jgi:hypothetical protein
MLCRATLLLRIEHIYHRTVTPGEFAQALGMSEMLTNKG